MSQGRSHRSVVTRHGGPEVLQLIEEPLPEPLDGEVRVRVLAAGVSGVDVIYRRWAHLPGSPSLPFTLGGDVVGTVDALGEGVSSLELGDLVAGATWSLGIGGGYSENVCLAETELVRVPPGVDPVAAVCVVLNYLTAHEHLHHFGRAQRGERLLVHGAAGGVGTALLDLGRLAGLEMYGTASALKAPTVSAFGATPIDYRTENFVGRIRALTGDGVDLVIDNVGGAMHLLRSYRTLRPGGRLIWLGSAATETQGLRVAPLSMMALYMLKAIPDRKQIPMCPTTDKFALADGAWYRATLTDLLGLLASGALTPVVAERVPLTEAARAHEMLEGSAHSGKIVLVTSE